MTPETAVLTGEARIISTAAKNNHNERVGAMMMSKDAILELLRSRVP